MANTIILKGNGIQKEAKAAAGSAIMPGHLLERASATEVQEHSTLGGNAQRFFAKENEVIGREITVAYAAGDNVIFEACYPGMEVNALLPAAAAAVTVGAPLESNGDGTLKLHTPPSDAAGTTIKHESVVAFALEAVDNSAGGTPVRIKVEVA